MRFRTLLARVATAIATSAASQASATILLDRVNSIEHSVYDLSFISTNPFTTLSIAGVNPPHSDQSIANGVFLNDAGPNLLSAVWAFTPAAAGSLASQFDDGSGVNGLLFGGVVPGSLDTFSQTFATTVGSTYNVHVTHDGCCSGGNEFIVSVDTTVGVPEPAAWALMLTGFLAAGMMLRGSRRQGADAATA